MMTPHRDMEDPGVRPATDFNDPMQVAVRLMEIERDGRLIGQQVTLGMRQMTEQQASTQGDIREIERVVREIQSAQHEIKSHSSGLERLAASIDKHVTQQEKRWEKHEAENAIVASQVTMWRGVVIGFGVLAALLVGGTVYWIQDGFNSAAKERVRIDARLERLEAHLP